MIRAFNSAEIDVLPESDKIAGYLFDAQTPGSGRTFDWKAMNNIPKTDKLVFLAGGLNPDNAADAVRYINPDVVDVSSGVENDSGRGKDPDKIKRFAEAVRESIFRN